MNSLSDLLFLQTWITKRFGLMALFATVETCRSRPAHDSATGDRTGRRDRPYRVCEGGQAAATRVSRSGVASGNESPKNDWPHPRHRMIRSHPLCVPCRRIDRHGLPLNSRRSQTKFTQRPWDMVDLLCNPFTIHASPTSTPAPCPAWNQRESSILHGQAYVVGRRYTVKEVPACLLSSLP